MVSFSGQLYFRKSYFFTLFQSNYFDTTVTFSEQLFLQNSCFFLLSQNSHFFAGVIFQNSFFFGPKLLQRSHFLRIGSSLRKLLFETAIFSEELIRIKISEKRNTVLKQILLHSINLFRKKNWFWKKTDFSEKQYFALSTFSGELPC